MRALRSGFYSEDLATLHVDHYADFVEGAAPGVIALLRAAGIRHGEVLDIGCGGGQLSARLQKAGYKPAGVDVSLAMVTIARRRVPGVRFMQGSVDTARLPRCVAAVAVGEVFNYLRSEAEILRAFRNIHQSLESGGVLVFDVKEPLPGRSKKQRTGACWGKDWAVLVDVEEDPFKKKLTRTIVTFRKEGKSYRRLDETHVQVLLKASQAMRLLAAAGFSSRTIKGYETFKLSADRRVLVAARRS